MVGCLRIKFDTSYSLPATSFAPFRCWMCTIGDRRGGFLLGSRREARSQEKFADAFADGLQVLFLAVQRVNRRRKLISKAVALQELPVSVGCRGKVVGEPGFPALPNGPSARPARHSCRRRSPHRPNKLVKPTNTLIGHLNHLTAPTQLIPCKGRAAFWDNRD
jgi:hypothetical protein